MTDRSVINLVRAIAVVSGTLAIAGSAVVVAAAGVDALWQSFGVFLALMSVFFAAFAFAVIRRQPRNAVIWVMTASAFSASVGVAGKAAIALMLEDPSVALVASPIAAELPRSAAWILMFTEPAWVGTVVPLTTFGFLLFPDGTLPSTRWRPAGILAAIAVLMLAAGAAWSYRPTSVAPDQGLMLDAGFVVWLVAALLCGAALVRRFRLSSGRTREQFKWIVWGAAIFVPGLAFAIMIGDVDPDLAIVSILIASGVYLASYGIAVGKHRLFDVDVVLSRTVVAAGLAGFITVVYGVVVGGIGFLLGDFTEAALPLSVAATVVIAIAFQPLRLRMKGWADRLVFGERATPYEVLSKFSTRMRHAVTADEVIPEMAHLLTEGTGAERATVWMRSDDLLEPVATSPEDATPPLAVELSGETLPTIAGVDHQSAVDHDGELLGALTVTMSRGESLTRTEVRLVDDIASQAGLVLHNARLTAEREEQARERERLDHELRVAQLIQQSFLPKRLPEPGSWDIAAHYRPAREVGGDFYDFIEFEDDSIGIVIGDVTDKGMPAAMVMSATRTLLRSLAQRRFSPAAVLTQANAVLAADIPPGMFVTCFYGVLDPASGRLVFANAGHNLPAVWGEGSVIELRATGVPLGLMPGVSYDEQEGHLMPGSSVLLYSDGLVEAHDPQREMFGFPRLHDLLIDGVPGRHMIGRLLDELAEFTGPVWEQEDDVTLVTLEHALRGSPAPAM
jgi:serine phosphatase RsbU (regulator of sigma subunit)